MAYGKKMNPGVGPMPPGRKRPRRPVRGGYGGGMDNRGGSRMMRNPGMAPRPRRGAGPRPRTMRPPVGPGMGGGGPRPLPKRRPGGPGLPTPSSRLNRRNKRRY